MLYRLGFLIFFTLSQTAQAAEKIYIPSIVVTKVISIYDADTFRIEVKEWPSIVGDSIPIRMLGIDAPEIRGKCKLEKSLALAAKHFTVSQLVKAKRIELRNVRRGKYFRLLAEVYVDDRSLADLLIKQGHARHYDGGTREGWCT